MAPGLTVRDVLLAAGGPGAARRGGRRRREPLRTLFSPHLEKIPRRYFAPPRGHGAGTLFRDDAGAVARLLVESYQGEPNKVELAARLARRALELLEYELEDPRTDIFVDAAGSGQLAQVQKMIRRGQNVDGRHSVTGYSALHAACDFGHLAVVKALLAAGAELHIERKRDLSTACHCAAENGHADLVRYLVQEAKIDKMRKNKFGLTAFDFAAFNNHDLIMDILREPPAQVEDVDVSKEAPPTSRSAKLEWRVPDDFGVAIQRFEVSYVPIAGVGATAKDESEQEKAICQVSVDAAAFGPSPHRMRRDRERLRRVREMELDQERKRLRASKDSARSTSSLESDAGEDGESESLGLGRSNQDQSGSSGDEGDSEGVDMNGPGAFAWVALSEVLDPATKYAVTVRAWNAAGWSKVSDTFVFATLPDVPNAPVAPEMAETGATCSSLDITWAAPLPNNGKVIESYEVQVLELGTCAERPLSAEWAAGDDAAAWRVVATTVLGRTTQLVNQASGNIRVEKEIDPLFFTVAGLASGSAFRVRIRAKNAVGHGQFGPPSAVLRTRPATVATKVLTKRLDVSWAASVDSAMEERGIVRWEVQRTVPPREPLSEYEWRTAEWTTVTDQVPGLQRELTLLNLCPATMYFVRTRPIFRDESQEAGGSMPWSECAVSEGLVTKTAPPEEPLAPIVLDKDVYEEVRCSISHDAVRVTWRVPRDNGNDIDAFAVRFAEACAGAWQVATQVEFSEAGEPDYHSCRVGGLRPGCAYKFAVRAHNAVGWGPFSSPSAVVRTRPSAPPGWPRMVARSDSSITVEWDQGGSAMLAAARKGELRFQVQMQLASAASDGEGDSGEWIPIQPSAETADNQIVAFDLQPVTEYAFRVRAKTGTQAEWTNFGAPGGPFKTARRF